MVENISSSFSELDRAIIAGYIRSDPGTIELVRQFLALGQKDANAAKLMQDDYKRIEVNLEYFTDQDRELSKDKKTVAIICFKTDAVGTWDPSSVKDGIAGSEEAVIYASQVLVDMGYKVTVFANPKDKSIWSLPLSNPTYLSIDEWNRIPSKFHFDLGICWRRYDFPNTKKLCDKVFHWPHDSLHHEFDTTDLDGIFYLSKYQKEMYEKIVPKLKKIKSVISGNGLDLSHFGPKNESVNPFSCIYASNYARGLDLLLDIWPDVKKKFPNATLDIYYGRETWGNLNKDQIDNLVKKMNPRLGITEKGKVGHKELADAMIETSILAYPCNTMAETFCITVVKAQSAGCIPVTTRIAALNETVHPDAPSIPAGLDLEKTSYTELLISTMERLKNGDDEEIEKERQKYMAFGRTYTWKYVVDLWHTVISA